MTLHRSFLGAIAASCSMGLNGCQQPPAADPARAAAPASAADAARRGDDAPWQEVRAAQRELLAELERLRAELSEAMAKLEVPVAAPATEGTIGRAPEAAPDAEPATAPAAESGPSAPAAGDGLDAAAAAAPTGSALGPAHNWIVVAQRLIDEEDYVTAARVLNVAVDVDPNSDEVHFQRGVARHLLQSYQDALGDFQRAIELTSRQDLRFICLYNQACSLARLRRPDEAMEKLKESDAAGFRDLLQQMNIDPDLDSLRDLPKFKEFVLDLRTR